MSLETLLTLLLGGGAAATIGAFSAAIKSIRDGMRTREKDTIGSLVTRAEDAESDKDEANRKLEVSNNARDYWRNRAADLEYMLRQKGFADEVEPANPPAESKT